MSAHRHHLLLLCGALDRFCHHQNTCRQVVEKILEAVMALARVGYLEEDAFCSDGELTQTRSKTQFCKFLSFFCYKGTYEVDGFVVASEEKCKKKSE